MIESYQNMLRKLAWSFAHTTGQPFEDLLSVGYLAYLTAKEKYQGGNGTQFGTYLYAVVKNALIDFCRAEQDEAISLEQFNPSLLVSPLPTPEERLLFTTTINQLSTEAKMVCKMIFSSPHEYAVAIETPKKAKTKLKKHLRQLGWTYAKIQETMAEITAMVREEGVWNG